MPLLLVRKSLGEHGFQRILGDIGGLDEALLAAGDVGDDDRRAARGAFGIEGSENVQFHGASPGVASGEQESIYSLFAIRPCLLHLLDEYPDRPPQDSPTFQAASSATPNSSIWVCRSR